MAFDHSLLPLAFIEFLWIINLVSTQEMLLSEIKNQPEPVLREVWHYLRFLTRQREEEAWADLLPNREVEQEVLDILDAHDSAPR